MKNYYLKNKLILLIFLIALFCPIKTILAKTTYPRLANCYLYFFNQDQFKDLAKWDLLIIQPEMIYRNPDFFKLYHQAKPNGYLLAYAYPAMFYTDALSYDEAGLRKYIYDEVNKNNWWLKNAQGKAIESWPKIEVVNVANQAWQNFNLDFLKNKIKLGDQWDGLMYDMVDSYILHYSKNSKIDINNDGKGDDDNTVNKIWQEGMAELFKKTRQTFKNEVIITNGNSLPAYQTNTNGRMFEIFPTPWEGDGTWVASMTQYLKKLPPQNKQPGIYVINRQSYFSGQPYDYQGMRFGLASTLLGDGYYSFDAGSSHHSQIWWYDEYDVNLGRAESGYYNLLDNKSTTIKPGLWRRDFENGIALVNSTNKEVKYIFSKEELEKIKGTQEPKINNGAKINFITLAPTDGIILLKVKNQIFDNSFTNGSFVRVFNQAGNQVRNGFFAYKDAYEPEASVLISDLDTDGIKEQVVSKGLEVSIYKAGRKITTFYPFGNKFKGKLSLAISNFNHDKYKELVIGVASGGGPQIRIFSNQGKLLSGGFFAQDKNFRGGINLAVGDVNGDSQEEIVVGHGAGLGPNVKIFNQQGKLLKAFTGFKKDFLQGFTVAVGDTNSDSKKEIILGLGSTGESVVRVYSNSGRLLNQFFAYDKTVINGLKVISYDINNDGSDEILASLIN